MKTSTLTIKTPSQHAFVEITDEVIRIVQGSGIGQGMVVVYIPHTTAGLTLNENADPRVQDDMDADLKRLVPAGQPYYRHFEGNSASHLKTSVMGNSLTLILENGKVLLGRWQGIYLCEFDGPRARKVYVKVLPG